MGNEVQVPESPNSILTPTGTFLPRSTALSKLIASESRKISKFRGEKLAF